MNIKIYTSGLSKILLITTISLIIPFTCLCLADTRDPPMIDDGYESGTLSAYSNTYYDEGCQWVDFQVTMDSITTDRRLLVTIEERNESDLSFNQTLWQGYLEYDETSSEVQPSWSRNIIRIKLHETDGYQTQYQIYYEGYRFSK